MKADFKVSGIREMEAAMAEFSKATQRGVLERALKGAAKPIETRAKELVPVLTGALRKSIRTVVIRSSAGKGAFAAAMRAGASRAEAAEAAHAANRADGGASRAATVRVQATAPHAHLIEFGTSRQAPRPFMRPAADGKHNQVLSSVHDQLRVEIEKTAKRLAARAARRG